MMQLIDVAFDNGQGDVKINLDKGVLEIEISEKDPNFPGGAQVNIPLDPIFNKLIEQAPNVLVRWGEEAAKALLDRA